MYMFNRQLQVLRNLQNTVGTLLEIQKRVNGASDVRASLWMSSFAASPNQVVFSAMVDRRSALGDLQEKLGTDPEYNSLVEAMLENVSTPADAFRWVLNADSVDASGTDAPLVWVMEAQVVGDMATAFQWSLETGDFVHDVTGNKVMVSTNTVGPIGQVAWMMPLESFDAVDAAEMALWSDPRYMERLADSTKAELFAPGVGGGSVYRRLG